MAISATDPPANTTPAAFKTWAQAVKNDLDALDSGTSATTIPPGAMVAVFGSPTAPALVNNVLAWQLTNAGVESIAGTDGIVIDRDGSMDVSVVWAKASTANGDVSIRAGYSVFHAGDVVARTNGSKVVPTAPATQYEATETTLLTGITVAAGDLVSVEVTRFAGDATDTITGNIAIYGVVVTVNPT